MVSYLTLTWTEKLLPNQKVNPLETQSLSKTLLRTNALDFQDTKGTNQQVSSTTEEILDQPVSQLKEKVSIEK